jgi:hypothetical protein
MIGKRVTFIRQIWENGDRGVKENREYTGIVLDKFAGLQRVEGKLWRAEYYLVELADGIIAKFFCDEAVRIEKKSEEPSMTSIIELEHERLAWSLKTFTEATSISSLYKCRDEIREIESDILMEKRVPEEYADALMCLFDSAGRQGIPVEEIFEAYRIKFEINKKRTWVKNENNTYSHKHITAPTVKTELIENTEDL